MTWRDVHPVYDGVTDGEARTVGGPIGGINTTAVSTVDLVLDMSQVAGHYVRITAEDKDVYYVFMSTASGAMDLADYADPTIAVPDIIFKCTSVREVVPTGFPYLHIRAKNAGDVARVKVRRA